MKKYHLFIALVTLWSCSQSAAQVNLSEQLTITKKECDKAVPLGNIEVCLPTIEGMTECYSIPIVKARAEKINDKGNSVMAVYLNDKTYKQVDELDEVNFDDYLVIYTVKSLMNTKMGEPELTQIEKMINDGYLKENWSTIKKEYDKSHDYIALGRPVLIESYNLNKKTSSFVMLNKLQVGNLEVISVMIMNLMIIKERLVYLVYFKEYDTEESIKKSKAKSDYMVLLLMEEND